MARTVKQAITYDQIYGLQTGKGAVAFTGSTFVMATATPPVHPYNFNFEGWSLSEEGPVITEPVIPVTGGELVLYAIWNSDGIKKVTFDHQTEPNLLNTIGVSESTLLPTPEKKVFRGWALEKEGEVIPEESFTPVGDTTLFAVFSTPPKAAVINFNANGGSGFMEATTGSGEFTLPDNEFTAPFGMVFDYWTLAGETTPLYPEQTIEIPEGIEKIEILANWKNGLTATVSYHRNLNGTDAEVVAVNYLKGIVYIGKNPFDVTGKVFKGWTVDKTETAVDSLITEGYFDLQGDLDFYAVWGDSE